MREGLRFGIRYEVLLEAVRVAGFDVALDETVLPNMVASGLAVGVNGVSERMLQGKRGREEYMSLLLDERML